MAVLICAVVGLLLGGLVFGGVGAFVGLILGVVIGAIVTGSKKQAKAAPAAAQNTVASRMTALELRVAELERELREMRAGAPVASGTRSVFKRPEWQEPATPAMPATIATPPEPVRAVDAADDDTPSLPAAVAPSATYLQARIASIGASARTRGAIGSTAAAQSHLGVDRRRQHAGARRRRAALHRRRLPHQVRGRARVRPDLGAPRVGGARRGCAARRRLAASPRATSRMPWSCRAAASASCT